MIQILYLGLGALCQGAGADSLNRPIDVDFNKTPLKEAVSAVAESTGLRFTFDPRVEGRERPVTLRLHGVRADSVLRLLLRPLDLGAAVRDGVLVILPEGLIEPHVAIRMYDLRDVLFKIRDFPGPRLEFKDYLRWIII